jgi:NAD(P)-dependent dehydrogenase (short-subunit alcohol dehydrogenase family)
VPDLSGRLALVAGCGPNIGAGIAVGLAHAGAGIVCLDRSPENAEECAAHLRRLGAEAHPVTCDVTDEKQVAAALNRLAEGPGVVDVLVNAAGFYNEKGLLEMSVEEWRRQIDVILTGTFVLTREVAARLVAQNRDGAVVNLISSAGHQGQPGNIAYSTAKSGLLNFTRAAAMDLAPHGIRVNSVTPTSTDPRPGWEMARAWGRDIEQTELGERAVLRQSRLPLQRLPVPEDYAAAVVFLASGAAGAITGTDICVDAGALGKYWAWQPGER